MGAKLVPQLAEQFKCAASGTTFDIAAEGSRRPDSLLSLMRQPRSEWRAGAAKPEEIANGKAKGVEMKETIVAYDGIAVIVNTG